MTDLQARPTLYKGIQMRSRLEAGYAAWLDSEQFTWEYEPRCYANDQGQYLPDFEVFDVPVLIGGSLGIRSSTLFVETKPTQQLAIAAEKRMEVLIESDVGPNVVLVVERPGGTLVRPLPWYRRWVVGQWIDPCFGQSILAIHKSDTPWHGEWWK